MTVMESRDTRGCEACSVMGPLLTAPGTSGRSWRCGCGTLWASPSPDGKWIGPRGDNDAAAVLRCPECGSTDSFTVRHRANGDLSILCTGDSPDVFHAGHPVLLIDRLWDEAATS